PLPRYSVLRVAGEGEKPAAHEGNQSLGVVELASRGAMIDGAASWVSRPPPQPSPATRSTE
ncbi:MAG TPA: hypothetical protein VMD30_09465, partial [Tepidisphaeraceae bacterium]|nr:hypothetical protein [Tepidisphaeraceae bacterium]